MPKPKLTTELAKEFTALVASGATNADACRYIGVDESTFYRWLKNPKTEAERQLCNDLNKAEMKRKLWHLNRIQQASTDGAWQASAWYLERRYPQEYAKPDRYHDQGIAEAVSAVKELTESIKAKADAADL